jgi:hypothetical protein
MLRKGFAPWVVILAVVAVIGIATWASQDRPSSGLAETGSGAAEAPEGGPEDPIASAARARPRSVSPAGHDLVSEEQELATRAAQTRDAEAIAKFAQSQLRARYESERVDADWARGRELALERASVSGQIPELGAEPNSFEAICRSSTCRIVATFDSRPQADDWFTLFSLNAGSELPNAAVERKGASDGTIQLDIYGLAKQP